MLLGIPRGGLFGRCQDTHIYQSTTSHNTAVAAIWEGPQRRQQQQQQQQWKLSLKQQPHSDKTATATTIETSWQQHRPTTATTGWPKRNDPPLRGSGIFPDFWCWRVFDGLNQFVNIQKSGSTPEPRREGSVSFSATLYTAAVKRAAAVTIAAATSHAISKKPTECTFYSQPQMKGGWREEKGVPLLCIHNTHNRFYSVDVSQKRHYTAR